MGWIKAFLDVGFEAHHLHQDMKNKIVLVGQAPPKSNPSAEALTGKFARTLCNLIEMDESVYLRSFDRFNIFDRFPGRKGKGDSFPMEEARRKALELLPRIRGRRVVFFGRRPAQAFGLDNDFLKWFQAPDFIAAIVPHPSGLNRWWNDRNNCLKAKRFLQKISKIA